MAGLRFGKGSNGEFTVNATESGKGVDAQVRVEGVQRSTFTAVQMRAANTTPLVVVDAPGTGFIVIVNRVIVSKASGTAFTGVAANEDLTFLYETAAVAVVADIETTGFLDQTTAEIRISRALEAASGLGGIDLTNAEDEAVEMSLLNDDITAGDEVIVDVYYERFPTFLVNV